MTCGNGWPMTSGVNRAGRMYVGDTLNQRIVRPDLTYAAEATVPVEQHVRPPQLAPAPAK